MSSNTTVKINYSTFTWYGTPHRNKFTSFSFTTGQTCVEAARVACDLCIYL
jgi:hypothetical protein